MNGDPNFIYYIDDGVEKKNKEARRAPRNKNEYARLGNWRKRPHASFTVISPREFICMHWFYILVLLQKSSAKVACERCWYKFESARGAWLRYCARARVPFTRSDRETQTHVKRSHTYTTTRGIDPCMHAGAVRSRARSLLLPFLPSVTQQRWRDECARA
jgi:hypothetical protein